MKVKVLRHGSDYSILYLTTEIFKKGLILYIDRFRSVSALTYLLNY